MEPKCPDRVLAFDSLFTTNHIQMLKLLVGYMEPTLQGNLAVYIKFLELKHTMKLTKEHPFLCISPDSNCDPMNAQPDKTAKLSALLDDLLLFCAPSERTQLQNMKNMFQTMANMQEMMEMMELLKEMSPELFEGGMNFAKNSDSPGGTPDLTQMMDMIQMMQGMFGGTDASAPEP